MDIENDSLLNDTNDVSEPRIYELGFHISPSLDSEGTKKKINDLKKIISKHGGEVISEGEPLHVDLAYEIVCVIDNRKEKYRDAHFSFIKFSMTPDNAIILEKEVSAAPEIIRSLLIRTSAEETVHSPEPLVSILHGKEDQEPEKPLDDGGDVVEETDTNTEEGDIIATDAEEVGDEEK